jgi:hypothetical protein
MKQDVSGSGAPSNLGSLFTLEGIIDTKNKLSRTVTSINVLGVSTKCTYVSKEPETIYVNVHPTRRAEFGAQWLSSDVKSAIAGVNFPIRPDQLDDDPERYFGDLEDDGTAGINGVPTTKYSGTFDLASLYPQGGDATPLPVEIDSKIPVSVFVDDDDLLRRIKLEVSSSENISIGFTIDFFDYGKAAALSEPPAAETKAGRPEQIATACFPKNLGAPGAPPSE